MTYKKFGSYDIKHKALKDVMAIPLNNHYQIIFLKNSLFIPNDTECLGAKESEVKIHGSLAEELNHWPRLIGILEKRTRQNDFIPINTKDITPHQDTKIHLETTFIRRDMPTIDDIENVRL